MSHVTYHNGGGHWGQAVAEYASRWAANRARESFDVASSRLREHTRGVWNAGSNSLSGYHRQHSRDFLTPRNMFDQIKDSEPSEKLMDGRSHLSSLSYHHTKFKNHYKKAEASHYHSRRKSERRIIRHQAREDWKDFAKRVRKTVHRIVDSPLSMASYRYLSGGSFRNPNINNWDSVKTDLSGNSFIIGGPARILDAASICFNGKVQSSNSFGTLTGAGCLPGDVKVPFEGASAQYELRNTGQVPMELEMYVSTPVKPSGSDPVDTWNNAYKYMAGTHLGTGGGPVASNLEIGSKLWEVPSYRQWFKTEVFYATLLPGQVVHKSVHIPKKVVDFAKLIVGANTAVAPGYNLFDNRTPQKHVFFRFRYVIETGTLGGMEIPPNSSTANNLGGLAILQTVRYKVRCPEAIASSATNQTGLFSYTSFDATPGGAQDVTLENPIAIVAGTGGPS